MCGGNGAVDVVNHSSIDPSGNMTNLEEEGGLALGGRAFLVYYTVTTPIAKPCKPPAYIIHCNLSWVDLFGHYPTQVKVSDQEMVALKLTCRKFSLGQNYMLHPRTQILEKA
jgi:hypothetical protein